MQKPASAIGKDRFIVESLGALVYSAVYYLKGGKINAITPAPQPNR